MTLYDNFVYVAGPGFMALLVYSLVRILLMWGGFDLPSWDLNSLKEVISPILIILVMGYFNYWYCKD